MSTHGRGSTAGGSIPIRYLKGGTNRRVSSPVPTKATGRVASLIRRQDAQHRRRGRRPTYDRGGRDYHPCSSFDGSILASRRHGTAELPAWTSRRVPPSRCARVDREMRGSGAPVSELIVNLDVRRSSGDPSGAAKRVEGRRGVAIAPSTLRTQHPADGRRPGLGQRGAPHG